MSVVIDANVLVVLALDRQRAVVVERQLRRWQREREVLHAPMLLRYELTSALARALAVGQLDVGEVEEAWRRVTAVPSRFAPASAGGQLSRDHADPAVRARGRAGRP